MPHCGPRPKKPVNAFLMWIISAGRKYIRAMHPGISAQEVFVKGSEMWGAMVNEEKVVWQEAARTAMADYKKKLEKWNTLKEQSEKTTQTDETVAPICMKCFSQIYCFH